MTGSLSVCSSAFYVVDPMLYERSELRPGFYDEARFPYESPSKKFTDD